MRINIFTNKELWKNPIANFLLCKIQSYDGKKYWKRRAIVTNPNDRTCVLLKLYYLFCMKRIESKHNSSTGALLNAGAQFNTPPGLPHGLNGIIIGLDAKIGSNCRIYQQVTIANGNVRIGNNVIIGAGAKILPNVTIGNNCKIGANCVVVEDIPDNATVVLHKPRIIVKEYKS